MNDPSINRRDALARALGVAAAVTASAVTPIACAVLGPPAPAEPTLPAMPSDLLSITDLRPIGIEAEILAWRNDAYLRCNACRTCFAKVCEDGVPRCILKLGNVALAGATEGGAP